jgi:hypothetical protein
MSATTHVHEYYGIDEVLEHFAEEYESEDITNFFLQYYAGDDGDVDSSKAKGNPEFTITVESGDERCDYYEENRYTVPLPNRDAADELAYLLDGKVTSDGSKDTGAKTFRITFRKEIYIKADSEDEAKAKFEGMDDDEMNGTSRFVEMSSCEEQ